MYKEFEEKVRTATPESLRASQKFFVDIFSSRGVKSVLDLGSGNGIFLDLLREAGIEAVGIEVDERLALESQKRGHNVLRGDVVDLLNKGVGSFDGVFASHLIEHFEPSKAFELLRLIHGSLNEGGVLLAVTPNPRSIMQHLRYFYCDYTHVRFYPSELLEFFLGQTGFKDIESGFRPDSAYIDPLKLGLSKGKIAGVKNIRRAREKSRESTCGEIPRWRLDKLLKRKIKHYLQDRLEITKTVEIVDQLNKTIWVSNFVIKNMMSPNDIFVIGVK